MRDDVLDQLRAENPVPQLLPALPLEVIRQRLDAGASIDRVATRRGVSLNVYRRRRMVLAGVIAATVLTVAGVVGFHTAAAPQPALAAEMNRLAQIVVSHKWIGRPGPGQFLYTDVLSHSGESTQGKGRHCETELVDHIQTWTATDGAGSFANHQTARFTSAADAAICKRTDLANLNSQGASEEDSFGPYSERTFPGLPKGTHKPPNLMAIRWSIYSTKPAALLREITRKLDDGASGEDPNPTFGDIFAILIGSDPPPAIRAALYQAESLIRGVKLIGLRTDPLGGTGLAVSYTLGGHTQELIFNRHTAALMSDENFGPDGLDSWQVFQVAKVVNSAPHYSTASNVARTSP
jgi:hypothetical protein